MVNIYLFLYQFFINGAGRCPTQPLNNLHFFSFPSIQVIRFILLFVFVFVFAFFFLFSATISNLTLGSRIVSSTVYPKPNGTLKENVTIVFSGNIVSFALLITLIWICVNSFQTSRSTPSPTKKLNTFRTVYDIIPNLATFPQFYLSWENFKIIVARTCAPPLRLPWQPSFDSCLFQNLHFFSFRLFPFFFSFRLFPFFFSFSIILLNLYNC